MIPSLPPPPPAHVVQAVPAAQTYRIAGYDVAISAPISVRKEKSFLWFPSLHRLPNGKLAAIMQTFDDMYVANPTSLIMWSSDDGVSWSDPTVNTTGCADTALPLPSGDLLVVPYMMKPRPGGMGAPGAILSHDKPAITPAKDVTVTGWPKPDKSDSPELGLSGFCFCGPVIRDPQGKFLATLYGYFTGTDRYSLVLAESADGYRWTIRSIIAGDQCKLDGANGPCEAALSFLKDGRLLCIYRMGNGQPYGESWSSDTGKTWTEPLAMTGVFSVFPSLAKLPDGSLLLSGGRPGLYLWLNADGSGKDWERIDILAHHNSHTLAEERIVTTDCYTRIVALGEKDFLYIYDRTERNTPDYRVWVVRVHVEKAKG